MSSSTSYPSLRVVSHHRQEPALKTYALDATPVLLRPTGIGRYVNELVRVIPTLLREDEELLLHAGTARLNPLFGVSHTPLRAAATRPRVRLRRLWWPLSLAHGWWNRVPHPSIEALAGRMSVFHGTNFLLPPTRTAASVVTIHDLSVLRVEDSVPLRVLAHFRTAVETALGRANHVIADSASTARDLVELFGVSEATISVIPLGVGPPFFDRPDSQEDDAHLARIGVARPFVLFVGTTNPRKNLSRVVRAFREARTRRGITHRLVVAGDQGFGHRQLMHTVEESGLAAHVCLPGYVDEPTLAALYRRADALLFPSLYEGFGLPVLEAFASGCPVITSTTSCLPEVAGDAALLVDPLSTDEITDALVRILTDDAERDRLRAAGRTRAREFTWESCAARHLDVYRHLAPMDS